MLREQDDEAEDEKDEGMDSVMTDVHFDQLGKASRMDLAF